MHFSKLESTCTYCITKIVKGEWIQIYAFSFPSSRCFKVNTVPDWVNTPGFSHSWCYSVYLIFGGDTGDGQHLLYVILYHTEVYIISNCSVNSIQTWFNSLRPDATCVYTFESGCNIYVLPPLELDSTCARFRRFQDMWPIKLKCSLTALCMITTSTE